MPASSFEVCHELQKEKEIRLVVGTAVAAVVGMVDLPEFTMLLGSGSRLLSASVRRHSARRPLVSMIMVMLITAVETTGDVFATGEIVEKTINREDASRGRCVQMDYPPCLEGS